MSLIQNIKNWPDKRKRLFSIITAIFLTVVIVSLWYLLYLPQSRSDEPSYRPQSSLSRMLQDITQEFTAANEQFSSTTHFIQSEFASSTVFNATTSTSTIATSTKTNKK